jgi:(p)ppGpp synthase/HD superfamily hydrolase
MNELEIAEQIARKAHAGQKDTVTGAPYITHVERVVAMVEHTDAKIIAWLHDVIEDSTVGPDEMVDAGIRRSLVASVLRLTRMKDITYADYIDLLHWSGDVCAIAVKVADLRDHLHANCPERLRPRYEAALKVLTA